MMRILSVVILVPMVALIYWADRPYWDIFLSIVVALLAHEWFLLIGNTRPKRQGTVLGIATLLIFSFPSLPLWLLMLAGVPALITQPHHKKLALLAGVYLAFPVVCIWLIGDASVKLLMWLALVVWLTDAFAMVFGKTIGGPKLAPKISPNKTWSGFFGGVLGALIGTGIFMIFPTPPSASIYLWAAAISVIGQCGDLFESYFKRKFNKKDSGNLIPGHGGVLDRMDSFLFAAPLVLLLYLVGFVSFQ